MTSEKHVYITQTGWLRRITGYIDTPTAHEPCVCIPVSWLGEDYDPDNPYTTDPAILAAKIRAYDAMHDITTSASTEMLRRNLERRRSGEVREM